MCVNQGFPIKKSKLFLHQNDVCKEDLVMTSQDKQTQDSNFDLQPDFHALPSNASKSLGI